MPIILKPAVFLDRDGVLIEDSDYVGLIEQVAFIPGAAAAVCKLNDAGFIVVVVTNQSGVARQLFPESQVAVIHEYIAARLAEEARARIDRFEYCPHHPVHGIGEYRIDCECRKPRPGMLLSAAQQLDIDLANSWLIGDRLTDLQAGASAGCRTILVRTGYGTEVDITAPDVALNLARDVPSIVEAVDAIIDILVSQKLLVDCS